MNAREEIARTLRERSNIGPIDPWEVAPDWARVSWLEKADAILAALESSGYTVAKLEQVAWHDDTVHRVKGKTTYATIGCLRFVEESAPEHASPLFRIVQVDDQEETK